jgi:hypothetical protein
MIKEQGAEMRTLLSVTGVVLLVIVSALAQSGGEDRAGNAKLRDRFVGTWHLASLEEPDADGKLHKADCTGLLIYTKDGHMAVQVMYRNPQTGVQGGSVQYAQGGYEASFGTYAIIDARTFTFHVEGAMVRSLVRKLLPRAYEFSGNQLIVKSTDPQEHWRVVWER